MSEEGSTVSCVVERTRGALDYVFVHYSISQIDSEGVNFLVADFANSSGIITFRPMERSEVNATFKLNNLLLPSTFRSLFLCALTEDLGVSMLVKNLFLMTSL